MINQRLHKKLETIKNGDYRAEDFNIADAKDGDMAFGIPGLTWTTTAKGARVKTQKNYLAIDNEFELSAICDSNTCSDGGMLDEQLCTAAANRLFEYSSVLNSTLSLLFTAHIMLA